VIAGGNPNLDPERGETWTAGLDIRPNLLPGFSASLTYYSIRIKDRIASPPGLSEIFADQGSYLGSVLIVAPTEAAILAATAAATSGGTIEGSPFPEGVTDVIVFTGLSNISRTKTDGIDVNLSYVRPSSVGDLTLSLRATKIIDFQVAQTETSPFIQRFDVIGRPIGFQSRASIGLNRTSWSGALTFDYKGSYTDTAAQPEPRRISSNLTVDLYGAIEVSDFLRSVGPGWALAVSVVNVFDKDPPFTNSLGRAWDGTNYSPLGRSFGIELRKAW